MSQHWYVDAWAVHDGRIFVSRREPDSIDAEATVFLSVPDLEPVPVGRISTALRATRSGFQDGLRDIVDAEIPFNDLGQVRELVRRAYLGGGLGPEAPGAVAGPLEPPGGGTGPGSGLVEAALSGRRAEWFVDLGTDWRTDPLPSTKPPGLDEAVRVLAQATVLEWETRLWTGDPEEVYALVAWITTLNRSGVFAHQERDVDRHDSHERRADDTYGASMAVEEILHLAQEFRAWHLVEVLEQVSRRLPHGWEHTLDAPSGASWSRGHLAAVPLPRLVGFPGAADVTARLRRLVEADLLARIDRRFWSGPRSLFELAPLVLVAAVRTRTAGWHWPRDTTSIDRAYEKLREDVRLRLLPADVEGALSEYFDRCIDGSTRATAAARTGAGRPDEGPERGLVGVW